MSSLDNSEFRLAHKEWPRHLITPSELAQACKQSTRLHIVKAPICSKIILQFVGTLAYLLAHVLNKTRVTNIETFNNELRRIERQTSTSELNVITHKQKKQVQRAPLITLSNHISCIDDPVLWSALLPLTYFSKQTEAVRWSAAAVEICFSKPWHSILFSLGKTFPVVRGIGLNQPGMEFASALLRHDRWLHLFPESRVMRDNKQQIISNSDRGYIFKWGISKLILDHVHDRNGTDKSERSVRILPFYHLGLDEILPIGWPYIPRAGKRITIYIRPSAIEINSVLLADILKNRVVCHQLTKSKSDDEIRRIKLTNFLEEETEKLIEPTRELHRLNK